MLLAIDPGLAGTGWAYWESDDEEDKGDAPSRVGVITTPNALRKEDFVTRARWIGDTMASIVTQLEVELGSGDLHDMIVCEFPNFQDSGARSMGWRSGDLQKLTFLVGVFAAVFREYGFVAVEPYRWKGQLPKQIVESRITKRIGKSRVEELKIKSHAWDAIGIGLWYRDGGNNENQKAKTHRKK